jgi:hypothetical protein
VKELATNAGVGDGERYVDQVALALPEWNCPGCRGLGVGHVPDGEVRREQRREEHQLRGQPDDRADRDRFWPILTTTQAR